MNIEKHPPLDDEGGRCFPLFLLLGQREDSSWVRFEAKEPSQYIGLAKWAKYHTVISQDMV